MSTDAPQPPAVPAPAPATASTNNTSTALAAPAPATAGVRAPRENALRHGLTANTLVEQLVGQDAFQALVDTLTKEIGAQSTLEQGLVRRAAHHLATLDLANRAELAALREGIRRHQAFGAPPIPASGAPLPDCDVLDAPLCSALVSDALDRVLRYGRTHERGLLATLGKLRELAASRPRPPLSQSAAARAGAPAALLAGPTATLEQLLAAGDAACEEYLLDRMRSANHRCPSCGAARGYWITRRRRWECHDCGMQAGARTGSVMGGSPLRLTVWFRAIGLIVRRPELLAPELARALGIRRLSTVRGMIRKVRQALTSPERGRLLAGLDKLVSAFPPPESGASVSGILRNGPEMPRATADTFGLGADGARHGTDEVTCGHPS